MLNAMQKSDDGGPQDHGSLVASAASIIVLKPLLKPLDHDNGIAKRPRRNGVMHRKCRINSDAVRLSGMWKLCRLEDD